MPKLGAFGAQELATRRNIVKKISNLDERSTRLRRRCDRRNLSAFDANLRALRRPKGTRRDTQPCDRTDRGKRLTSKAQAADGRQIIEVSDFARGVALHGKRKFGSGNTVTIIENSNEARSARFDIDINRVSSGIERVLDEFFDERGRPLDHFARSDLIDERTRQQANRHVST